MTPSEVLRKAADVIRERGWHQGGFHGPNGSVCTAGAINVASGRGVNTCPVWPDAWPEQIYEITDGCAISTWNDDPDRTAEEVIAALERAAELAEGK